MTLAPPARAYDETRLAETHDLLARALRVHGIDSNEKAGRRWIAGDENPWGAYGDELDEEQRARPPGDERPSGVFPVVKLEGAAIAEIRQGTPPRNTSASSGPSAGPSSVHTLDTTRPSQGSRSLTDEKWISPDDPSPRLGRSFGLLRARVAATRDVRMTRARVFDAEAERRRRQARRWGWSKGDIRGKRVGDWHEARARGLRSVLQVVCACQEEKTMVVTCQGVGCGVVREAPVRCRRHFFCVSCRGQRTKESTGRLHRAFASVRRDAYQRGLYRRRRHGGRWGVKLLTLTAPHVERYSVRERTDKFAEALPLFERKLRRYAKERESSNIDLFHWYRSTEWTACQSAGCSSSGPCDKGHPHAHCALHSHYIEQSLLAEWWCEALRAQGYELEDFKGNSNVDIRDASGGKKGGVIAEVVKYIFKDIDAKGEPIDPHTFAQAYSALVGRRLSQCSRGLMKRADVKKACTECGRTGCFRVSLVDGVRADLRRPGVKKARAVPELQQLGASS